MKDPFITQRIKMKKMDSSVYPIEKIQKETIIHDYNNPFEKVEMIKVEHPVKKIKKVKKAKTTKKEKK